MTTTIVKGKDKARITPKNVATPFPPLNLKDSGFFMPKGLSGTHDYIEAWGKYKKIARWKRI